MNPIKLFKHQQDAVDQLKTGSILCGGVGSGKTITAISYFYTKECDNMTKPKDLYVITTAAKRDTLDWERESALFSISTKRDSSISNILLSVDSWNNIKKYVNIKNAFFIFDEQRVIGSGSWVKSFLQIVKNNNWILLSATPGDTWMDYVPAFVANKFYKNRTEFLRRHVVYNRFSKFPKIDHYVDCHILERHKKEITIFMPYKKPTVSIHENILVNHDKEKFNKVWLDKWNIYEDRPIKDVAELCFVARRVVNSDSDRIAQVRDLVIKHRRIIVFYNFNYELDELRFLKEPDVEPEAKEIQDKFVVAEYNGHIHEPIPDSESWIYLVQYTAGSEGWNCITANTVAFYSLNYSYRIMTQAAGRIDRLNTPFAKLYYYTFRSSAPIDIAILKALANKKDFNESIFKTKF